MAGVDAGARFLKVVFVDSNRQVIGKKRSSVGFEQNNTAMELIDAICDEIGIRKEEIKHITATGAGKNALRFCNSKVSNVLAVAKAVSEKYPEVRTIIGIGAEESRVVRIDSKGKVLDTAVNERCAAGTGAFVESMARALDMTLKEFAERSMESEKKIAMNAQCAVFAESEVVSLLHSGVDRRDIARAVNDAIANRVASMARKVRVEPEVILVGGMAKNTGFVVSLKNVLELDNLLIPQDPEFMEALGAALYALENT